MKIHSNALIIIALVLFSNFVSAQRNIGIKLPYYIDNPTAVQKIPEDTVEVRCEYCKGQMSLFIGHTCMGMDEFWRLRSLTDMERFRHYHREPLDSLNNTTTLIFGSIMAILDTVTLEKEFDLAYNKDSVYCFSLLIWNMGKYYDTNCINFNVDHYPLKYEFEEDTAFFPAPHIDSVYLYVTHDEIEPLFEMIKNPESNEFLFTRMPEVKSGHYIFPQFFPKNTFDITKKYSYSQIKRHYLRNRHRGYTIMERKKDGTHYYTICD